MAERIAKFLGRAGICSRRQAEQFIAEGRVKVDGSILLTPATLVDESSKVEVDGKPVAEPLKTRVWCYYKPVGYVTTHHDPQGRITVFQDLQAHNLPRVISVGRLDLNSEGLLLLTNDGGFSRFAELPKTGWARRYRVRVYGRLDRRALQSLKNGITIEGIHYDRIDVEIPNSSSIQTNNWLRITLFEGKNREIRKVMNHLGLQVNRLIREGYGPFELGSLEPHQILEIPSNIISKFFQIAN
ncbi:pseudouridine synthase [Candidatus Finniella inopinata]|uniref:Pseudouridine synthase n=1 Tax=Candidatus Finniella inopinata TaxID=1696036 RepID=A0A4V2E031_9PROT|nr:pseudouridine synthase [Candidatus Finniella inopinata]RZI47137.1 rRNA pseudouridine synthase [Candidatus Finniella inopinata]